MEDVLFNIFEEAYIVLVCAHFELLPNVLQKMHMADLYNDIRKDIDCCLLDCRIIITCHRDKGVIHVLELYEELYPWFEALWACEKAAGKIMCGVIHSVEEWNLLLVAFYLHILPIHDKCAAEAFPVAVPLCDLIVVRKNFQLFNNPSVRSANTSMTSVSKCADTCSL